MLRRYVQWCRTSDVAIMWVSLCPLIIAGVLVR